MFLLGQGTLSSLIKAADEVDFAILVMTSDDVTTSRGKTQSVPRDNVLFELGLFMGVLGPARTFFIFNKKEDIRRANDLDGVTGGVYELDTSGKKVTPQKIKEKLDPVARKIMDAVSIRGLLRHPADQNARGILEHLRQAYRVEHRVFDSHFRSWIEESLTISQKWAGGELCVAHAYNDVLLNVYRYARKEIVSTSVPEYRSVWNSDEGDLILKTQCANKTARSTRIFIFRDRKSITSQDKAIFRKQLKHRIRVQIHLASTKAFFAPSLENDWTIVDGGKVVGLTKRLENEKGEANWYFFNQAMGSKYASLSKQLLATTQDAKDFL
jgi:hypothetical protein